MMGTIKQLQVNSQMHQWFRRGKDRIFLPIAKWLARYNVTPNIVTGVGAAVGLLAIPLLWVGYGWFVLAAAVSLFLDGVDGSLARYTKKQTPSGAQLDYMVDVSLMFLMVSALAFWLQQPLWVTAINWHVGLQLLNWILGTPVKIAPGRVAFLIILIIDQPTLALAIYLLYAAALTIAIPLAWYKRKSYPFHL